MDYFQMIPILALMIYILYLSYYYAAPMFYLRVLLLIAYKKYRCKEIQFTEEKVSVRYIRDGEECVIEQPLGVSLDSRFFVFSTCSVLREMLRALRKGEYNAGGI